MPERRCATDPAGQVQDSHARKHTGLRRLAACRRLSSGGRHTACACYFGFPLMAHRRKCRQHRWIRPWIIRLRTRIPAVYQPPDMQVPPGQAPCPAPLGPAIAAEPTPPQCPAPTTLGDLLFADGRKTPADNRCGAFQKLSFVNTYLPRMGSQRLRLVRRGTDERLGPALSHQRRPAGDHARLCHALAGWAGQPRHSRPTARRLHRVPLAAEDRRAISGRRGRAAGLLQRLGRQFDPGRSRSRATFPASTTGRRRFNSSSGPRTSIAPTLKCCRSPGLSGSRMRTRSIGWCFRRRRSPGVSAIPASSIRQIPSCVRRRQRRTGSIFAGELGGGTWAIRHSDGTSDLMSYGDWRVYLGLETRID